MVEWMKRAFDPQRHAGYSCAKCDKDLAFARHVATWRMVPLWDSHTLSQSPQFSRISFPSLFRPPPPAPHPPSHPASPASGSSPTVTASRGSDGRTSLAAQWTPPFRPTTPLQRGTDGRSARHSPACRLASERSTTAPSHRARGSSQSESPTCSIFRKGSPNRWLTYWCLLLRRPGCGLR